MSEADLLDLRQNNKLKNVYSSRSRKDPSPLFEIARVLVCPNDIASRIVNANHGIM